MSVKARGNLLPSNQTSYIADSQNFVSNLSPLITNNILLSAKESRIYTKQGKFEHSGKNCFFS